MERQVSEEIRAHSALLLAGPQATSARAITAPADPASSLRTRPRSTRPNVLGRVLK
ncbi:MAG: hypothetical protein WCH93_04420 [Actinomycetota bacterium]